MILVIIPSQAVAWGANFSCHFPAYDFLVSVHHPIAMTCNYK
jgi:hypothetical protein